MIRYGFKVFRHNKDGKLESVIAPSPGFCAWAKIPETGIGGFPVWFECPLGPITAFDYRCHHCNYWQPLTYVYRDWNLAVPGAPLTVFMDYKPAEMFRKGLNCIEDMQIWLVEYDESKPPESWDISRFPPTTTFASRVKPIMKLDTGEES